MAWPDIVNGSYESLGGIFIALSCIKAWKDKDVKGVSWLHVAFFTTWGYWNLFYYPHLGQWVSFWGGIVVTAMNTLWVVLLLYYGRKKSNGDT